MANSQPARTVPRRTRSTVLTALVVVLVVALVVIGVMLVVGLIRQPPASSATATPPGTTSPTTVRSRPRPPGDPQDASGNRDVADGAVPDGATVFDDEFPAVANLDPELLGALRRAATDAADDGVEFSVNSGWRSPAYQEQLLREAVKEHGSEEEAARWVATPETSPHVSGDAIDLGPSDTTDWLSEHGAAYGLCQIYDNEPWHYELRPEAMDDGCPPTYADASHDPRMRQ